MIRAMLDRRVKNHEFARMYIMSYTKRLSEIREVYGNRPHKERVYDKEGKATNVFEYWLTPERKTVTNAMKFEKPKSNFFTSRMRSL